MRVVARAGWVRAALALTVAALSAGLVFIAASPAGTAAPGKVVSVTLVEWKLVLSQKVARAGRVSFVVRNDGTMPHELVVIKSNLRAGGLPVNGGSAVEKGKSGEISQIPAGASKRVTLTLRPGKYILLCNILGHYQAGQFAALQVR